MTASETIKSALRSLGVNKIRSFLTMLGVIIGVFAVVALVSVIQGFKNYITDQFNALGSNLVYVMPGMVSLEKHNDPGSFTNNKLEEKNVDTIKSYLGNDVVAASAIIRTSKIAKYKTKSYNATISAGNADVIEVTNVPMEKGKFYTKGNVSAKAKVVVIGKMVKDELFATRNPIGEKITIGGSTFTVIGVGKAWGPSFDDRVFMPDTTAKSVLGITNYTTIAIKLREGVDVDNTIRLIKLSLLKDMKSDEFTVLSQKDILSSVNNILGMLTIALAAIAGISLFVGGIGIMNIMLVSVTERTREIGLRKALGATPRDILYQFMTEAIIISVLGGLIGLLMAWGATLAIQSILNAQVPWWSVALGFGFSLFVGVVFGTYPAISASKKDPIEALRYE
jgi:putative ABC transport system permease protein